MCTSCYKLSDSFLASMTISIITHKFSSSWLESSRASFVMNMVHTNDGESRTSCYTGPATRAIHQQYMPGSVFCGVTRPTSVFLIAAFVLLLCSQRSLIWNSPPINTMERFATVGHVFWIVEYAERQKSVWSTVQWALYSIILIS